MVMLHPAVCHAFSASLSRIQVSSSPTCEWACCSRAAVGRTREVDDARGAGHALLEAHAVADLVAHGAAHLLRNPPRYRQRRLSR